MVLRATNFFAVLFLLAVFVSPAHAKRYNDIVVEAGTPPNVVRMHGYGEYRIFVSNTSLKDRHRVTLILPQQSYFGGTVKRTITVEPASTANVSLFVGFALSGNGLAVEVDGQPQGEVLDVNFSGYTNETRPSVLISQGASSRAFQTSAGAVLKNAQDREDFSAVKSETAVGEWSTSWLGYSSYDGIVLTADEMRAMGEPAASALIRYVECGGALLVIGAWQPPKPWRIEKEQDGSLTRYNAGFGVCMVSENGAVEGLTGSNWRSIGGEWEQSQMPWAPKASADFEGNSANKRLPVTENVSIPVRGLLLIMLVFVILIGPVNLLVLSKKRKRMWLLWTVPAISLLTCFAVSAYTLFSEGWSGRARYLSYTILDERSHRASTLGFNAFYTPLTPGDGLRYGAETEISPQWSRFSYSYENGPSRIADWTEDQHLETGWVTARTPAHFRIRRSETRRERLTVTRGSDGSLSVVNGLGVPIRKLRLADEKGIIHDGSNIAAGASAVLSKTNDHLVTKAGALRRAFAGDWVSLVQRDAYNSDLSRPMTYIADLDTCPFLEEGLKNVKQKKFEGRVFGIMKGPGDED